MLFKLPIIQFTASFFVNSSQQIRC